MLMHKRLPVYTDDAVADALRELACLAASLTPAPTQAPRLPPLPQPRAQPRSSLTTQPPPQMCALPHTPAASSLDHSPLCFSVVISDIRPD